MGCIFLDSRDRPCGQPTLAGLPWCQPHVEFILAPAAAAATQPDPDDRPLFRGDPLPQYDDDEDLDPDDDDYIVIPPPEGYDFDDRFAPPHARPRLVRRADLASELPATNPNIPSNEPGKYFGHTSTYVSSPLPDPADPNVEDNFDIPDFSDDPAGTDNPGPWPPAPDPSNWRACAATTSAGKPCRARPLLDSTRCFFHDPASRDQLLQATRNGGRASAASRRAPASLSLPPLTTRTSIQATLEALVEGIIGGGIPTARAHAIARILAVATRNFDPYIQSRSGATPFHNPDHYRRFARRATFPTTPTDPGDAA
jgi:hypothetical protein